MNSNGIVSFEIEGVDYTLNFGMKAIRIFIEKSSAEMAKINSDVIKRNSEKAEGEEHEPLKPIDDIKAVVFAVYAGLCNNAERYELEYPEYSFAYDLTEKILLHEDKSIQARIWETFKNSRANEGLINSFSSNKSETDEEEKKKKQIGIK